MIWPALYDANLESKAEGYVIYNVCPSWKVGGESIPDGTLIVRAPEPVQWGLKWRLRLPEEWYDDDGFEDPTLPLDFSNRRQPKRWRKDLAYIAQFEWQSLQDYAETPAAHRKILDTFRAPDMKSFPSVVRAKRDLPGLGLKEGDLIHLPKATDIVPAGNTRPVTQEQQEPMREAFKAGDLVDLTPWRGKYYEVPDYITDGRKWGRRKKVWEPMLFVTRPFVFTVSEPIRATSDEAAIFELVLSTGCMMPVAR